MKAELIESLPALLKALAREHGIATARRLALWRGGVPVYVPKKITENHPLAKHIGLAAAGWLVARYPIRLERFPPPKAVMDAMPRRPELRQLSAPPLSEERRQENVKRLADMLSDFRLAVKR